MCIIIAKPVGIDLPTTQILENCFTTNRDGIGFAFNKPGDRPIISKGFANIKKLNRMLETFNIGKDHNVIIHFRLATHGQKDQGNCHPFPLTYDFEDMRRLHCACDTAIAHNGIFGEMKASEKYSDTMKFIGVILASPEIIANLDSGAIKELIRGYCGHSSKLAFLKPSGLNVIGDFEIDQGIYYSNTQYKSWNQRFNSGTTYRTGDNEYCAKHKVWDKCHKIYGNKTWCYLHQNYDDCTWCIEHKKWDSCEHDAKNTCGALTDLRTITCEECNTKDDVLYSEEIKANLCPSCLTLYFQGYTK